MTQQEPRNRNRLLQSQLRLAHLKEGEQEIRQTCTEYADVVKLPGDKLTSTSAVEHRIPTPTIPTNRAITLRNYWIPEHHQTEVDNQIKHVGGRGYTTQSPRNFPILIVPKKMAYMC
jgi:hypothetical protein